MARDFSKVDQPAIASYLFWTSVKPPTCATLCRSSLFRSSGCTHTPFADVFQIAGFFLIRTRGLVFFYPGVVKRIVC